MVSVLFQKVIAMESESGQQGWEASKGKVVGRKETLPE